ncbi:hypothetical protein SPRG_07714 [Saprolegnia parasitica CBS 223.65]|uniref:MIT domain-containing protein n=1 Tax=Saprolegnia parasitica (strain CBS 223.65) TaxID=695850 RepID=A0A067CKB6_SAPPC|nr:hypothetical protein SPRG_07714 [Saprolegnia parasitica CBS 223.65]KDO27001.1 hypothetical protein SPRG_07714 [Saprolegnia parasitica CBS 223.65]|eukprot:XP_012202379.1 hypothetical protein SPRG_07714 [Saprolegnia parasitica CBS 223.65]
MLMKPTAGRPQRAATSRSAVVLGHQYALEAEEYASSGHLDRAEQLEQLASQCYLRALDDIGADDVKTRAALKLIAENHEQRAVRWQMALAPDAAPRPSFPPPPSTTTSAAPFVPAPTSAKSETSSSAPPSATSMREAASEMEDLFERLKALGLPGYATNGGARPTSKQYLSSDLGDSFCLLPTGNARMPLVSRVDGETTLKAAIGNRNKNHRERYLSQLSTAPSSRLSIPSPIKEDEIMPSPEKPPHHDDDGLSSSPSTDAMEHLRAALATHKHEIARLTHTVKTLSSENAKLRQVRGLTTMHFAV